jgi:hypothetical protein
LPSAQGASYAPGAMRGKEESATPYFEKCTNDYTKSSNINLSKSKIIRNILGGMGKAYKKNN